MEILTFALHFLGIKKENNKPTQIGNLIPWLQSMLIAQRKFASVTEKQRTPVLRGQRGI